MKITSKFRLDIPLSIIVLLAVFLNGYEIWNDQYVNTYYTTTVASMLQNFHNFFFASLDSAGFVTVDKPPLTFWIQTVFASIFGLHGWSVILPQALSGVGSVILLYTLIKPSFGLTAARLSALVMATTPVVASVSRTNNIDSMLVFTLLIATWLLFRGIKNNRVWSLIGAFAMIGVAFNMKMMQAYMVLPAFYLFTWMAWKINWKKKVSIVAGASALMLLISMSWALVVDSIPASSRPYIGSSETNSVMELAFGYNGISRLTGEQGGGGGAPGGGGMRGDDGGNMRGNGFGGQGEQAGQSDGDGAVQPTQQGQTDSGGLQGQVDDGFASDSSAQQDQTGSNGTQGQNGGGVGGGEDGGFGQGQPPGGGGFGGGSGGRFGTGEAGPLRLFQSGLSGQASWLIPFAAFACVGLFANLRRRHFTQQHKESLFWLAWLVPVMGFFSVAGFFHQYYLIMLAAPIAALVGAGWKELAKQYHETSGWMAWLLPAAIPITAIFELYIMRPYDDTIGVLWSIFVLAGSLSTALLLIVLKRTERVARPAALIGLMVLLVGPLYWAATPITYGQNSMLPQAGPSSTNGGGGMGGNMAAVGNGGMGGNMAAGGNGGNMDGGMAAPRGGGESSTLNTAALQYLKAHNTGETYLFATTSYTTAAPYIIESGENVIIMGGFSGSDPVLSLDEVKELITSGKLKYFMVSSGGGGRGGSSEVLQWIQDNGTEIPSSEWQQSNTNADQTAADSVNEDSNSFRGGRGGETLYEVALK
ncbi:glycosyltransferase family 39 protein [Paenibacillus solisilvae]|uniref:Glycosyltransferase family 39 protein n=1 Tax=Paenibacillus solisilvae TaxID=2486751 RepID=A0ABW0W1I1_9BACL